MAYWRLCYHFVWTTKERWPYITAEVEPALYRWLYNEAKKLYARFAEFAENPKLPIQIG